MKKAILKSVKELIVSWGGRYYFPLGWRRQLRFYLQLFSGGILLALVLAGLYQSLLLFREETLGALGSRGQAQLLIGAGVLSLLFLFYFVFFRYRPLSAVKNEGRVYLWDTLGYESRLLFEKVLPLAEKIPTTALAPELLWLALLFEKETRLFLLRAGIQAQEFKTLLENQLKKDRGMSLKLTEETESLLKQSYGEAQKRRSKYVELGDLALALSAAPKLRALFQHFGLSEADLALLLNWWQEENIYRAPQPLNIWQKLLRPKRNLNLAWTAQATPTLNRFSEDLTELARLGFLPKARARKKEIQRAILALSRRKKNNLVLVGQPGVGKSSVVGGIALEMLKEDAPQALQDKKLISLNTSQLVAGANDTAELQELLAQVIEESSRAGNIVLYIPNTHLLASEKGGGIANLAGIMLPALQESRLQLIGTSNPEEYRAFIENNEALASVLERIEVEELDPETAVFVLTYLSSLIEKRHGALITLAAIKKAVELSVKFIHDRVLPDKAEDLLDEAAAISVEEKTFLVTAELITRLMEEKIKVPIKVAKGEEGEKLLNLEKLIHQRLINQEEAVKVVSDALRRARSGLAPTKRPIGNFLFVGPTGVGKTELAKTLSAIYFGSEEAMVRLDMTEFKTTESIYRLIGAPLGTAESEKGGLFTEAVRQKPFSLILLDELEKAAPNVRELFLQVMDEGRLTDSTGRLITFTNSIIIATSNAGSPLIAQALREGRDYESLRKELIETVLLEIFSPEFLNRFDAVVVFKPLALSEIIKITQLQIEQLKTKLADRQIKLEVESSALQKIARLGFDPVFGARPLRRVIQNKIENEIAKKLLAGEIKEGDRVLIKAELI